MATLWGKTLTRQELLRRAGNVSQFAHVRPFEYRSGKADGLKAYDIVTGGGLDFTVVEGKCLDIIQAKYKGINLNFLAKPGLVAPALAEPQGRSFLRSVSGGLFYTCGLSNVGAACNDEEMDHCFHGRTRNIPAEASRIISRWDEDDYLLGVEGEMRDAALFHDNLVLRRSITTRLGATSLAIHDEVENEGFEDQALMIMYHINIGYPILDAGTRLLLPKNTVSPMDAEAAKGLADYRQFTAPVDHFREQVFFHQVAATPSGQTAVAAVNDRLALGIYIKYKATQLPNLIQWKSMMSGDYVLGLEPANCLCKGRLDEKQRGTLKRIAPFQKSCFDLEIGVLDGADEINAFAQAVNKMKIL